MSHQIRRSNPPCLNHVLQESNGVQNEASGCGRFVVEEVQGSGNLAVATVARFRQVSGRHYEARAPLPDEQDDFRVLNAPRHPDGKLIPPKSRLSWIHVVLIHEDGCRATCQLLFPFDYERPVSFRVVESQP